MNPCCPRQVGDSRHGTVAVPAPRLSHPCTGLLPAKKSTLHYHRPISHAPAQQPVPHKEGSCCLMTTSRYALGQLAVKAAQRAKAAPLKQVAVGARLWCHRGRACKPCRRAQHAREPRRASRGRRRTNRRTQAGAPCGNICLRLPDDEWVAGARRLHRTKNVNTGQRWPHTSSPLRSFLYVVEPDTSTRSQSFLASPVQLPRLRTSPAFAS